MPRNVLRAYQMTAEEAGLGAIIGLLLPKPRLRRNTFLEISGESLSNK
jgi:hypothetical protein